MAGGKLSEWLHTHVRTIINRNPYQTLIKPPQNNKAAYENSKSIKLFFSLNPSMDPSSLMILYFLRAVSLSVTDDSKNSKWNTFFHRQRSRASLFLKNTLADFSFHFFFIPRSYFVHFTTLPAAHAFIFLISPISRTTSSAFHFRNREQRPTLANVKRGSGARRRNKIEIRGLLLFFYFLRLGRVHDTRNKRG